MLDLDILKPFEISVWIAIILLLCIIASILKLFSKQSRVDFKHMPTFILTFGVYCQQGVQNSISTNSARCLLIFLSASSILLYNFYTSVLVSTIIETRRESKITSKEDLARSNIPVAFQNAGQIKNFIRVMITLFTMNSTHKDYFFRQQRSRTMSGSSR